MMHKHHDLGLGITDREYVLVALASAKRIRYTGGRGAPKQKLSKERIENTAL